MTLSVQNNWGGPDSADKRDWFAGAVVELFPEFTDAPSGNKATEEPDLEDVETVLLQVMMDEFDVNVDDDSALEVAKQIINTRTQCANGQFEEVNQLQQRFADRSGGKVDQLFKKAEDADQDTDWESGDSDEEDGSDDGDVDMDEAPALVSAPKEKAAPEVDEDGFTMVSKKKR